MRRVISRYRWKLWHFLASNHFAKTNLTRTLGGGKRWRELPLDYHPPRALPPPPRGESATVKTIVGSASGNTSGLLAPEFKKQGSAEGDEEQANDGSGSAGSFQARARWWRWWCVVCGGGLADGPRIRARTDRQMAARRRAKPEDGDVRDFG